MEPLIQEAPILCIVLAIFMGAILGAWIASRFGQKPVQDPKALIAYWVREKMRTLIDEEIAKETPVEEIHRKQLELQEAFLKFKIIYLDENDNL